MQSILADHATILIDVDGRYVDASAAALELLGVDLATLRSLPPNALSVEPDSAAYAEEFRSAWEREGGDGLFGRGTLRRPDGGLLRVAFAITAHSDGRYLASLRPAPGATDAPAQVYITAGEALGAWRAAERRLETLGPESAEAEAVRAEIAEFRQAYQDAFRRQRQD